MNASGFLCLSERGLNREVGLSSDFHPQAAASPMN
jgi:hypothetical protein